MIEGEVMGLFDRFRKRVREVAEEADEFELVAAEDSTEAQEAIAAAAKNQDESASDSPDAIVNDWDDLEELDNFQPSIPEAALITKPLLRDDEDWDDDDDDASPIPTTISKKERKRLEKETRRKRKDNSKNQSSPETKPKGSEVDLVMMRSTTGRQLVKVESAPRGSSGTKHSEDEFGKSIEIDLGGGVVESSGKVIKQGAAFDKLLEELEWLLLESDISSLATTAVMGALQRELLGNRLRKGAKLEKVLEASLKRALNNLLVSDYWDFNATVDDMVKKAIPLSSLC